MTGVCSISVIITMKARFSKRVFTAPALLHSLGRLMLSFPRLLVALSGKHLPQMLREKIFLTVSAVNGCDYCTWFHAGMAQLKGMSKEDIQALIAIDFEHFEAPALPAMLYAQAFALTSGKPGHRLEIDLVDQYGEPGARDIQVFTEFIQFANLAGNTFDAFLARLTGTRPLDGGIFFEFIFFLFAWPILCPLQPMVRTKSRKSI